MDQNGDHHGLSVQKWSGFHFCLVFLTLEEDEEVMLQHSLHCTIFFPRKKRHKIYISRDLMLFILFLLPGNIVQKMSKLFVIFHQTKVFFLVIFLEKANKQY